MVALSDINTRLQRENANNRVNLDDVKFNFQQMVSNERSGEQSKQVVSSSIGNSLLDRFDLFIDRQDDLISETLKTNKLLLNISKNGISSNRRGLVPDIVTNNMITRTAGGIGRVAMAPVRAAQAVTRSIGNIAAAPLNMAGGALRGIKNVAMTPFKALGNAFQSKDTKRLVSLQQESIDIQDKTLDEITSMHKTILDYIKYLKRSKLDELEKEREKRRAPLPLMTPKKDSKKSKEDQKEGNGLLGKILGGLTGVLGGKAILKKMFGKSAAKAAAGEAGKKVAKEGAKEVGEKVAKEGAKEVGEKVAKEAAEEVGEKVAKEAAESGAKKAAGMAAKSFVKKIPGIGLLAGLGFAAKELFEGDFVGAGMEVASGAASTIPGFGTAGSVAIDAAIIARNIQQSKSENNDNVLEPDTVLSKPDPEIPAVARVAPGTPSTIQETGFTSMGDKYVITSSPRTPELDQSTQVFQTGPSIVTSSPRAPRVDPSIVTSSPSALQPLQVLPTDPSIVTSSPSTLRVDPSIVTSSPSGLQTLSLPDSVVISTNSIKIPESSNITINNTSNAQGPDVNIETAVPQNELKLPEINLPKLKIPQELSKYMTPGEPKTFTTLDDYGLALQELRKIKMIDNAKAGDPITKEMQEVLDIGDIDVGTPLLEEDIDKLRKHYSLDPNDKFERRYKPLRLDIPMEPIEKSSFESNEINPMSQMLNTAQAKYEETQQTPQINAMPIAPTVNNNVNTSNVNNTVFSSNNISSSDLSERKTVPI